jgi:phage-related minor tail protein
VVSTAVHDVKALFGDVVAIAEDGEAFVGACRAAAAESPSHVCERRLRMQQCVWRYSWDETGDAVHRALEALLASGESPSTRLRTEHADTADDLAEYSDQQISAA